MSIRGYEHKLFTIYQNKTVLSNFDTKIYICNCNIHTYFYGSNEISSECKKCK